LTPHEKVGIRNVVECPQPIVVLGQPARVIVVCGRLFPQGIFAPPIEENSEKANEAACRHGGIGNSEFRQPLVIQERRRISAQRFYTMRNPHCRGF
jgi:hypothetical protein